MVRTNNTSRLMPHSDTFNIAVIKSYYAIATVLLLLALIVYLTDKDHEFFFYINQFGPEAPEALWQSITMFGDTLFSFSLVIISVHFNKKLPWQLIIATLLAALVVQTLKLSLQTLRPPAVLGVDNIFISGPVYLYGSFPSGHTQTAFVIGGLLAAIPIQKTWRFLILSGAFLAGLSRVIIGVHWPTDVLVGAAVGLTAAAIALKLVNSWQWCNKPVWRLSSLTFISIAPVMLISGHIHYAHAQTLSFIVAFIAIIMVIPQLLTLVQTMFFSHKHSHADS